MDSAIAKGMPMEKKRVSISAKRQITLPQKFFAALGFSNEAECYIRNDEIVIRPVKQEAGGEFAEQILADLISQGYSGDELLSRFKTEQRKVRPAVLKMIEDAENVASGKGDSLSFDEVFGSED